MLRRQIFVALLLTGAIRVTAEAPPRLVELQIVPKQRLTAIAIRGGEHVLSVPVRNDKAIIPADLPLPWSLQLLRFEADVYEAGDLHAGRPWVLRELGRLRGTLQRRTSEGDRYTWLIAATEADVRELHFAPDREGGFELKVPAGTYYGALVGPGCGTRVRSGIIVKPGETTDLGAVTPDPAVAVSVRVVESRGGGVSGARVVWDPPSELLNARVIRSIFGRRWSAVTNRSGIARIEGVGPLPHTARWRVEAAGFAKARTAALFLKDPGSFAAPDVVLRPEPALAVRITIREDDAEELRNATLVWGENRNPETPDFDALGRVPLREGESVFKFASYGVKRVWVESAQGRKLMLRNVELRDLRTVLDITLRRVVISGRVTQDDKAIEGALVSLADPMNGALFLGQTPSGEDGRFQLLTWAMGPMQLYTIGPATGAGRRMGRATATVDLSGNSPVFVDLDIPKSGFALAVVDRDSGEPVRARLDVRSYFADGSGRMSSEETGADGKFDLSGFPQGRARLQVVARGYRTETVEIAISEEHPELTVRVERADPSEIRVIDPRGMPIRGATVIGGFEGELDPQPFHRALTDAAGTARFDSPPPPGTLFYVTAPGYALGNVTAGDRKSAVTLHPPSSSVVTLIQNDRPPEKVFLVMAAPAGGTLIPLTAFEELAQTNGMNFYQLCGTSPDGQVVLPQFLGAGSYDLFLARRGGRPFVYEKVGRIQTPLERSAVISLPR